MRAKVIRAFRDIEDPSGTVYQVGDTFEGTDERVGGLAEKGFVEKASEAKAPAKAPAKRKAAKNG